MNIKKDIKRVEILSLVAEQAVYSAMGLARKYEQARCDLCENGTPPPNNPGWLCDKDCEDYGFAPLTSINEAKKAIIEALSGRI